MYKPEFAQENTTHNILLDFKKIQIDHQIPTRSNLVLIN